MPSSSTKDNVERGYIIPIGGAEEKLHNPEILDRFVDVCGGRQARRIQDNAPAQLSRSRR